MKRGCLFEDGVGNLGVVRHEVEKTVHADEFATGFEEPRPGAAEDGVLIEQAAVLAVAIVVPHAGGGPVRVLLHVANGLHVRQRVHDGIAEIADAAPRDAEIVGGAALFVHQREADPVRLRVAEIDVEHLHEFKVVLHAVVGAHLRVHVRGGAEIDREAVHRLKRVVAQHAFFRCHRPILRLAVAGRDQRRGRGQQTGLPQMAAIIRPRVQKSHSIVRGRSKRTSNVIP